MAGKKLFVFFSIIKNVHGLQTLWLFKHKPWKLRIVMYYSATLSICFIYFSFNLKYLGRTEFTVYSCIQRIQGKDGTLKNLRLIKDHHTSLCAPSISGYLLQTKTCTHKSIVVLWYLITETRSHRSQKLCSALPLLVLWRESRGLGGRMRSFDFR